MAQQIELKSELRQRRTNNANNNTTNNDRRRQLMLAIDDDNDNDNDIDDNTDNYDNYKDCYDTDKNRINTTGNSRRITEKSNNNINNNNKYDDTIQFIKNIRNIVQSGNIITNDSTSTGKIKSKINNINMDLYTKRTYESCLVPQKPYFTNKIYKNISHSQHTIENLLPMLKNNTSNCNKNTNFFYLLWYVQWPIWDLLFNEILIYLLPTHRITLLLKFYFVLFLLWCIPILCILLLLLYLLLSLLFVLYDYQQSNQYQHDYEDVEKVIVTKYLLLIVNNTIVSLRNVEIIQQLLIESNITRIAKVLVLYSLCISIPLSIIWYLYYKQFLINIIHRTSTTKSKTATTNEETTSITCWNDVIDTIIQQKIYIDPYVTSINRLSMHVHHIRYYTNEYNSRRAACIPSILACNDILHYNVTVIDTSSNNNTKTTISKPTRLYDNNDDDDNSSLVDASSRVDDSITYYDDDDDDTTVTKIYESERKENSITAVVDPWETLLVMDTNNIDSTKTNNTKQQNDTNNTTNNNTNNKSLVDNVYRLDDCQWKFCYHTTVESGLQSIKLPIKSFTIPIVVPSNWMLNNKYNSNHNDDASTVPDIPIYTNIKYPFIPCSPPAVPFTNNPTGVYYVEFVSPWTKPQTNNNDNVENDSNHTTIDDDNNRYSLLFHGVESSFYVFLNQTFIGFSKDSRLPAEFDITDALVVAKTHEEQFKNYLYVVVVRWSDSTYLEDQDHWMLAGIHRSVELIKQPYHRSIQQQQSQPRHPIIPTPALQQQQQPQSTFTIIRDFCVQADANGHFECSVELSTLLKQNPNNSRKGSSNSNTPSSSSTREAIIVRLYDDKQLDPDGNEWKQGRCVWSTTIEFKPDYDSNVDCINSNNNNDSNTTNTTSFITTFVNACGDIIDPHLWTAETPYLYTVTVSLVDLASSNNTSTTVEEINNSNTRYVISAIHQSESCRVGFRTVSIDTTSNVVLVNNKKLTACGINRHEFDPDTGKVISLASMHRDICLMKQNNFNVVRTSHYPNHESFYKLCDYYGMFVWDEANLETHGMKPMGRLVHDWGWENSVVSRITRMVQRDRNHCCIIIWSLGNEAGRGRNLWKARAAIQQLDQSRLICYESGGHVFEGSGRTELTDVICSMYPDIPRTKHLAARSDEDRPVILCEYSHAMGNSNGNIHYYWQAIWDDKHYPRLQGGCIWDFVDQALRVPDPKNPDTFYFAYGGDFGDTIHDGNFCCNGIFSPDRIPHPAAYEIKYLQQWVTIAPSATQELSTDQYQSIIVYVGTNSKASISLSIVNRYNFIDLSHLAWSWQITSNRSPEPVRSGRFLVPKSGSTEEVPLSLDNVISRIRQVERSKTMGVENTYHLNIRGYLRKNKSWAGAGHVLVSQQLHIKFEFDELISSRHQQSNTSRTAWMLESIADDNTIRIFRSNERSRYVLAEVDRISGVIVSYSPNGENILNDGILPNFVRAAVDNDKGGLTDVALAPHSIKQLAGWLVKESQFSYHSQWKNVGLSADKPPDILCLRTRITEASSSERIGIVALCVVRKAKTDIDLFKIKFHYTIYNDGRVRISNHVVPLDALKALTTIARVGLSMQVTSPYHNIQYYGRGPHENYPDRKSGSEMGVYITTPSTMGYNEYVYPVENGSRSDCEWISFRANDGNGFCIVSTTAEENLSSFSCSALLHSSAEYETAGHSYDLESRQNGQHPIHVSIDHRHMGIGGDTSWYPVVYPEFRITPDSEFQYNVWLLPLEKGDEAALQARDATHV